MAFAQAVRARKGFWSWPRKVYAKEFLQGVMLADMLEQAGDVSHIHGHYCHGATTVTWFASMMTKLPFSFTAHAKDIYLPSLNPAGLLRRKMDAARFVITCTDANRDYLENLGSKTPVYCIYHGLNAEFCNIMKEQPAARATNGHFRVLGVGRLIPKKGFDILVQACAILHQKRVPFEAVIVAEGGEHEEEIRRLITVNGLENSIFLPGPMSQSQLFDEYRKASAFCLPCRVLENGDRDGIPNVLMEAMAVGVPVVSTPISGIPELIHDGVMGCSCRLKIHERWLKPSFVLLVTTAWPKIFPATRRRPSNCVLTATDSQLRWPICFGSARHDDPRQHANQTAAGVLRD